MSYEWVDRQPYFGEVVDQGLGITKGDKVFCKIVFRVLGKVSNIWDPEKSLEPIPEKPEVEMTVWFDGDSKQVEYRLKDLQRMGFTGDDVLVLDPQHEKHQSFVGQRTLLSPHVKEGTDGSTKVYWNPLARPKKKPVDLTKVGAKTGGIAAMIQRMNAEKAAPPAEKAAVPF